MIIKKIGNRGIQFLFEEEDCQLGGASDTCVYLIKGKDKLFLCDTHAGSKSMEPVKKYIKDHGLMNKELIIFNSHSDWDHIWGNEAFGDVKIIAHEKCKKRIAEKGQYDLEKFAKYHNGEATIKLPNLTFQQEMRFEEEGVVFIYAPGHTACSAICIDEKDSVVFVGDLVEYPNPYMNHYDLEGYIKTLEYIRDLPVAIFLSSHSDVVDREMIEQNISYIDSILKGTIDKKNKEHSYNINNPLLLKYEEMAKEKLGTKFDYRSFRSNFWRLLNPEFKDLYAEYSYTVNIEYDDLEHALKTYVQGL